jgi:hypothetical protein
MKILRYIVLFEMAVSLALGQSAAQSKPPGPPNQSEALVRSLYTEVVSRHPHDIPEGADMEIFAPYLSKDLLHRIDLARACSADWDGQNPEPHLKAEMASSYGLFSGEGAQAEPRSFQIEKTESEKDGSLRVYVNLTGGKSSSGPGNWRVAVVLLLENGHSVIDDVIYINDNTYDKIEEKPPDERLSEYLSAGCNGPHWAGSNMPGQPEALVHSLYQQAVTRTPGGIPRGTDWKIFAPYMSKTLLHRIDLFLACADDWARQDQKRMLVDPIPEKAPFGVYESGIFSGDDERTEPRTFHLERTESEKDGSVRVYVRLTLGKPHTGSWWAWNVAPILIRENERLVVDDVIYLKDEKDKGGVDYRLSQALSAVCDGPHWVGNQRNDQKQ